MGAISPVSTGSDRASQATPSPEVQAQVDSLIRARDASHQRVSELVREKAELASAQEEAAFDLEAARHELAALKQEHASLRTVNESLAAKLGEEQKRIAEAQEKENADVESLRAELEAARRQFSSAQADIVQTKTALAQALADGGKNAQAFAAANEQIATLTEANREANERLAEVSADADQQRQRASRFEKEHQLAAENAAREAEMRERCERLSVEQTALKAALKRGEEYVAKIEQDHAGMETLRKELDAVKKERDAMMKAAALADKHLEEFVKRERAADERIAGLSAGLNEQTSKAAHGEEAAHAAAAHKHRVETMTIELDVLKEALSSAEKSLQQLTRENSTKEQDIARLNKALSALRGEPASARTTAPAARPAEAPSLRLAGSAVTPATEDSDAVTLAVDVGLYKSLLEEVPEILKKIRRCLQYFVRHPDDLNLLHELVRHTESICEKTDMPEFEAFHRLSSALGALMRDLYARPDQVNPPLLRTVCQSFDFLGTLFEEPNRSRAGDLSTAKVLAVDDDAGILDALGAALEMVDLKMDGVDNSRHALEVLARRSCDLIFLDVGLPEMTGIELCEQIRQLPNHAKTPIVFLTGLATIENRVQSTLKGANDFICKPFNLMELDVKALGWLLKKRLDML